ASGRPTMPSGSTVGLPMPGRTLSPFARDHPMGSHRAPHRPSADEALELLIAGNQRFLHGETRATAFCRETLAELAQAQRPYVSVLGCSDSRVAPELIFDAGLGELF